MWWRRQPQAGRASDEVLTSAETWEAQLSAYLDGELDERERAEVDARLAVDAEARAVLDDLRLVTSALGTLQVRAPRSFALPASMAASMAASTAASMTTVPHSNSYVQALAQRIEWGTRAAAGVAALLFVVALTIPQGSGVTPVATGAPVMSMAAEASPEASAGSAATEAMGFQAFAAPATEPQGTAEADVAATQLVPGPEAMAPPPTDMFEGARTGEGAGGFDGAGGMGGGVERAPGVDAIQPPVPAPVPAAAPEAGTFKVAPTSDSTEGVAPALASLAVILAALAALMARYRPSRTV